MFDQLAGLVRRWSILHGLVEESMVKARKDAPKWEVMVPLAQRVCLKIEGDMAYRDTIKLVRVSRDILQECETVPPSIGIYDDLPGYRDWLIRETVRVDRMALNFARAGVDLVDQGA